MIIPPRLTPGHPVWSARLFGRPSAARAGVHSRALISSCRHDCLCACVLRDVHVRELSSTKAFLALRDCC